MKAFVRSDGTLQDTIDQGTFSFVQGRAVQEVVTMHNIACRFNQEWDEVIENEVELLEHRAEEAKATDGLFDLNPDEGIPATTDRPQIDEWGLRCPAGSRRRIDTEDLYKIGDRVIGRHDAVVDKAWYFRLDYFSKQLNKSGFTLNDMKALISALETLQADKSVVLDAIDFAKAHGAEATIEYYGLIASEMQALEPDSMDAMDHRNYEGFAHNREGASNANNPEWQLLLEEGVPSAAMIAHDLHISLEVAGDLREAIILQDFDSAQETFESSCEIDDEGDILDDGVDDDKDYDSVGFVSEGWHPMDEKVDDEPMWLDLQPVRVQMLFAKVERARNLKDLKALGEKVYALEGLSQQQRKGFWGVWHARRNALLLQTEQRIAKVRKGVQRILTVDPKDFGRLGKRLHDLSKDQKDFYSPEGWAVIWGCHKAQKAARTAKPRVDRAQLVAQFLQANPR